MGSVFRLRGLPGTSVCALTLVAGGLLLAFRLGLVSAKGRLLRTTRLVKVVRGARELVTTGAFPQALWGHVSQGIAPTVVDRFRTT